MEKFKFEFTKEELQIIWEMVDITLKAGGLSNLKRVNDIVKALQAPIKDEKK